MTFPIKTEYDVVPYPSGLYPQAHPEHLAALATLWGMKPSRVEKSRVLELGCGDGSNLIAMAHVLPESQFYGIDLAAAPVEKGCQIIKALGLSNIHLRQINLLDVSAELGRFDYIVAHGLYSWAPEDAREKILAICRDHLLDHGVAYVSYNAYPGNHLRDLARRMMRFHTRQFSDPPEQIRQGRTLLKFLSEAKTKRGHWQDVLSRQFERVEKYIDAGFYHDDLSAINQPFYFHEFMEAAARHELQFLSEADFTDMQTGGLTDEAVAVIGKMENCDLIAYEQYKDFIEGRSFRQTLLCHANVPLDRNITPDRVFNLFVAGDTKPARAEPDLAGTAAEDFQRGKAVIATGHPLLKAALVILGESWPRRMPLDELLTAAREKANRQNEFDRQADKRDLGEFLVRCYGVGFVDLHAHPSIFVTRVSERPAASDLARFQIERGPMISSLRHLPLKIEDALGRNLLRLLDGTRNRSALLEELEKLAIDGSCPVFREGRQITDPQDVRMLLAEQLEPCLANLATLGVLKS